MKNEDLTVKNQFELAAVLVPELVGMVGLSGGSTMPPLLQALGARSDLAVDLTWTWIDERLVPYGQEGSNYGAVRSCLAGRRAVPLPSGEGADAAEAYMRAVSGGALPTLDVLLLGFGDDGHVASLFPGSAALEQTGRDGDWILRSEAAYEPRQRWSWTMNALLRARQTWIIYKSDGRDAKAERVRQAREDAACDTPLARFVRQQQGSLRWVRISG